MTKMMMTRSAQQLVRGVRSPPQGQKHPREAPLSPCLALQHHHHQTTVLQALMASLASWALHRPHPRRYVSCLPSTVPLAPHQAAQLRSPMPAPLSATLAQRVRGDDQAALVVATAQPQSAAMLAGAAPQGGAHEPASPSGSVMPTARQHQAAEARGAPAAELRPPLASDQAGHPAAAQHVAVLQSAAAVGRRVVAPPLPQLAVRVARRLRRRRVARLGEGGAVAGSCPCRRPRASWIAGGCSREGYLLAARAHELWHIYHKRAAARAHAPPAAGGAAGEAGGVPLRGGRTAARRRRCIMKARVMVKKRIPHAQHHSTPHGQTTNGTARTDQGAYLLPTGTRKC